MRLSSFCALLCLAASGLLLGSTPTSAQNTLPPSGPAPAAAPGIAPGFLSDTPQPAAPQKQPNCEASLVADTSAISPGKPFTIAVRFQLAPSWHLYWQFPGDSGAAPSVSWELPPGFEAGPLSWPLPKTLDAEGDIRTFTYDHEAVLLAQIRPPASLPPGPLRLKAKVKWFVCSDTCVPGSAVLSLDLPSGEATPHQPERFAAWKALLPQTTPPPFTLTWKRDPKSIELHLQNLPKDHAVEAFPLPPKDLLPGKALVTSPTPDQRIIRFPLSEPDPGDAPWKALLVLQDPQGTRRGWEFSSATAASPSAPNPASTATPTTAPTSPSSTPSTSTPARGLAGVLWGAFLGGLLLNLMPCVLPVIALKIFGFTQQAGQDSRRVFRLGLAFTAGVFAFFLGLAAAVIALQAAGSSLNWGFQFQNPWILVGLISAVFVFGLNLLGVFEIALASGTTAKLSALSGQHGFGGAFLHGLFTTLLGTSCTAPYLGFTLGFAVSQPAPQVILIFLTIAAGMSLPYLVLTANPALLRFLPKPGGWMERLKQGMGFIMLGVAVWLLSVLGQARGVEVLAGTCAYLLTLGVGCWLLGISPHRRLLAWIVALGFAVLGSFLFLIPPLQRPLASPKTSETSSDLWQPFSPARVQAERAAGHPVFVDFTADWCLNCKVNERLTLSKKEVLQAFHQKKVVLLKADWTNGDETITAELRRFGRVGVPFYLLYPPGTGEAVVFPELLSPGIVLEALEKLPASP